MKVFLTGATGFIGNYLIKELIDAGYDVIFLSRYRKEKFYDDNSKVIQINKDISMLTPNDLKDVSVIAFTPPKLREILLTSSMGSPILNLLS